MYIMLPTVKSVYLVSPFIRCQKIAPPQMLIHSAFTPIVSISSDVTITHMSNASWTSAWVLCAIRPLEGSSDLTVSDDKKHINGEGGCDNVPVKKEPKGCCRWWWSVRP